MPIPQSQKLKSALLNLLSDRKTRSAQQLTDACDKLFRVNAGEWKKFEGNVEQALTNLKKEGLVELDKNGSWKISKLGLDELESKNDMKEEEELARED